MTTQNSIKPDVGFWSLKLEQVQNRVGIRHLCYTQIQRAHRNSLTQQSGIKYSVLQCLQDSIHSIKAKAIIQ